MTYLKLAGCYLILLTTGFYFSCSPDDTDSQTPTGGSPLPSFSGLTSMEKTTEEPAPPSSTMDSEPKKPRLDCSMVESRVHTAYTNANVVGLSVKFVGLPPGTKYLDIWWDEFNDPTQYQHIRVGQGEVQRDNENLFDVREVIEHTYHGIEETATRHVKVSVTVRGLEGGCWKVRDIEVEPPPEEANQKKPTACFTFEDRGGMGRECIYIETYGKWLWFYFLEASAYCSTGNIRSYKWWLNGSEAPCPALECKDNDRWIEFYSSTDDLESSISVTLEVRDGLGRRDRKTKTAIIGETFCESTRIIE